MHIIIFSLGFFVGAATLFAALAMFANRRG